MGGYGSGRYQRYAAKDTVEHAITLNIASQEMKQRLFSDKPAYGNWQVTQSCSLFYERKKDLLLLRYTLHLAPPQEEHKEMSYAVRLSSTVPPFGGFRVWCHCPRCNRRCGKLYLAPGEHYFLCRVCADLTYESTRRLPTSQQAHFLYSFQQRIQRTAKYLP